MLVVGGGCGGVLIDPWAPVGQSMRLRRRVSHGHACPSGLCLTLVPSAFPDLQYVQSALKVSCKGQCLGRALAVVSDCLLSACLLSAFRFPLTAVAVVVAVYFLVVLWRGTRFLYIYIDGLSPFRLV